MPHLTKSEETGGAVSAGMSLAGAAVLVCSGLELATGAAPTPPDVTGSVPERAQIPVLKRYRML